MTALLLAIVMLVASTPTAATSGYVDDARCISCHAERAASYSWERCAAETLDSYRRALA